MGYWGIEETDGSVFALVPGNGVHVQVSLGTGMPLVGDTVTPYSTADGGYYALVKDLPTAITLVMGFTRDVARVRNRIISIIDRWRSIGDSVPLHYYGRRKHLVARGVYAGGFDESSAWGEKVSMRFVLPDPRWYDVNGETSVQLFENRVLDRVRHITARINGEWSTLLAGANGIVYCLAFDNEGGLYAGGAFTHIGGFPTNYIARWDGAAWEALGTGVNGPVYTMAFGPDGGLYVGGNFTVAGGVTANRIARWDPVTGEWQAVGLGVDGPVYGMCSGDAIYVAGDFGNAGGNPASRVARWDGESWSNLGSGLAGPPAVGQACVYHGGYLYVTGAFVTAGGTPASCIARWDGASWSSLGSGLDATGWCLAVGKDGMLYVGGDFTLAGGRVAYRVAQWNGTSWSAMGDGFNHTVRTLMVHDDGTLFAGGAFTESGSRPISAGYSRWAAPVWVNGDGAVADGMFAIYALAARDTALAMGGNLVGAFVYPATVRIWNPGTRVGVQTILYGPGTLYHLVNHTTGHRLDFNLPLAVGERVTIDTRFGKLTLMSNVRGNLMGQCIGSLSDFFLTHGDNVLTLFVHAENIKNGGFEIAGEGGMDVFSDWIEQAGSGAVIASSTCHSGAVAARLDGPGAFIYQYIGVRPGVPMRLEFWTRGDGTTAGRYQIYDNTHNAPIVPLTSTGVTGTVYQKVEVDFTVPSGCTNIFVGLHAPGVVGTVYFDDVGLSIVAQCNFTVAYTGIDGGDA